MNGKVAKLLGFALIALSLSAYADDQSSKFPQGPDAHITPGSLCETPDSFRYPERIKYCSRAVDGDRKVQIIRTYDSQLGFAIQQMPRSDFKIDHLIPLCAGGSNQNDNLWPQHKSVYAVTDPFEPALCDLMAAGKLKQSEVVDLVLDLKHDLTHAPALRAKLRSLGAKLN